MPRNAHCRECDLFATAGHVCVWGDGDQNPEVLFVGEAPGREEAKTGKPFQGKSGQLLRRVLGELGYSSYRVTNTVRCHPPGDATPLPVQVKACRPYLDEEIRETSPRAIVALGATATKALKLGAKITSLHGLILPGKPAMMACFHPAYVLRDPSRMDDFKSALIRLRSYLDGKAPDTEVEWEVVNRDNLERFLQNLEEAREFSFDLETSGLDWYSQTGYITCVGIGLDRCSWVIPMNMPNSSFPTWDLQLGIMEHVFSRLDGKPACAQNGKFDNLWLKRHFGRGFTLTSDTQLAHHLLDENRPHGLKVLSRTVLGAQEYDLELSQKKGGVDPETLYGYNAKDCAYTLRINSILKSQLRKQVAERKIYQYIVMPAARMLEEVETTGLFVRLEKFQETAKQVSKELAESLQRLNEVTGQEVNWNSSRQVSNLLYNVLKLPVKVKTAKGAPSSGEEALLEIDHPVVKELIRYREVEKFRSTYLDGWRPYLDGARLHLGIKISGTVTGRWSSRLHQVPRDGTIRHLISAPPWWKFVQGDFSQAELRVAAIMADEPQLLRCYREGIDVHWETLMDNLASGNSRYTDLALKTGATLAGRPVRSLGEAVEFLRKTDPDYCISLDKGWKEARKLAKSINFGYLYGQSAKGYQHYAKVKFGVHLTEAEATDARNAFFRKYRRLQPWHARQIREATLNQYVESLIGRKRRLPTIKSDDRTARAEAERQAINAPVQGFIGDLKAMAMIEIHEELPKDKIRVVGEVHDSILMEVREDSIDEILPRVRRIMENPWRLQKFNVTLPIPISADLEIGPWGQGKKYEG